MFDPVKRFRTFLEDRNWWDDSQEQNLRDKERLEVLGAIERAEKKPLPPVEQLFDDVYHTKPSHLLKQEKDMLTHIAKYPDHYQTH